MPLDKHFGGHGDKVAAEMKKRYGKDWKRVFYATDASRKKKQKRKREVNQRALKKMRDHGG